MAVLDFPANPTVGQEYEFPPYTYVWDGEKWSSVSSGDSGGGTGSVSSVNGETGDVVLDATDVGAVNKAGDTMTGVLTIATGTNTGQLKFGSNNQQYITAGTDDNLFINAANGTVVLSGIDPPGIKTGSNIHNILTENTGVKKAGDTVSGVLKVSTGAVTSQLILNTVGVAEGGGGNMIEGTRDGVREWYVGNGGATEVNITLYNSASSGYIVLHETGETQITTPVSHTAQGTTANSLVRKDYLDGGFVPKSNGASEFANQVNITNKNWGEQTDKFRTGSINAPAGSGRAEFCDWIQWGHNGGQKIRHTLWCPADSSKPTELWYATQNNTTDTDGPATHWRVYHQGFAPTALDVGAASIDRVDTLETELRTIIKELQAEIELLKKP